MTAYACEHLALGDGTALDRATIVVDDAGRITEIIPDVDPQAERIDGWVAPGFVDTHCHGAGGADFSDPDPEAVRRAIGVHRSHGSTTLFASTVTAAIPTVCEQLDRMRPFVESGEFAGIHLEGPFLAPERKGAHQENLLCDPTPEALDALLETGGDIITMVTMAPERAHALESAARFREQGIIPAFGHSNADAETTRAGVAAGMNVVTHLFNAMCSIHHRVPGPIPLLLDDPQVAVELICDGIHVHRDVVRMSIDAAGLERVLLVTDAMSATGQPDGSYELGGLPVIVTDGAARLATADGSEGALAGSTLTMDKAFSFVVNEVGLLIADAARLASGNPARVHGLTEVGILEPGRFADLCVVDEDANLQRVMRRGEWIA